MAEPRSSGGGIWIVPGTLVLILGGLGMLALAGFFFHIRHGSGSFDRARFEAVVERVRRSGLAPGEERTFQLGKLSDPSTLGPRNSTAPFQRGQGAGDVWARLTKSGKLQVVIETRDLGHAGEYGFAYSEEPLLPKPFGSDWYTVDVPGRLNLVQPAMRIDSLWWEVLYNLD